MASVIHAPGFTDWDAVAYRNNVIPAAGSYGGADPHRFGRRVAIQGRGPMRAPGGLVAPPALAGLNSFEEGIPFFAPLAAAESGYKGGAVIVPKRPCSCTAGNNGVENAGGQYALPHGFEGIRGFVPDVPGPAAAPGEPTLAGLGYVFNGWRPGDAGNLGALTLPFGMDSQSLVWIVGLAGAGWLMWKLAAGNTRKAKAVALRKARARYRADAAKIQARYA
jgi:hypothetical protein